MLRKIGLIVLTCIIVIVLSACGTGNVPSSDGSSDAAKVSPTPTTKGVTVDKNADLTELKKNVIKIEIVMQSGGVIKANLYPDIAPETVENFMKLVDSKFYDGLIFHRVMPQFMIQGGGFDTKGQQKEADTIKGEFASNGVENNLLHSRGVLSMARLGESIYTSKSVAMNSASSQFFIMVVDYPSLDGEYASFGEVTSGMDVADKIVAVETDSSDKPLANQTIKTIKRVK